MRLTQLREWREYRGMTQQELSELTGVSRDGISNYENGERAARPSTARRLAKALDVSVEDLTNPPGGVDLATDIAAAEPEVVREAVADAFAKVEHKLEMLPPASLLDLRDSLSEDLKQRAPRAVYLRAAISNYLDRLVLERIEAEYAQETLFAESDEVRPRKEGRVISAIEGVLAAVLGTNGIARSGSVA